MHGNHVLAAESAIATVEIPLVAPRQTTLLTTVGTLRRRRDQKLDASENRRTLVVVDEIFVGYVEWLVTPRIGTNFLHKKSVP